MWPFYALWRDYVRHTSESYAKNFNLFLPIDLSNRQKLSELLCFESQKLWKSRLACYSWKFVDLRRMNKLFFSLQRIYDVRSIHEDKLKRKLVCFDYLRKHHINLQEIKEKIYICKEKKSFCVRKYFLANFFKILLQKSCF